MGRELTSAELEQVFGGASDEVVVTAKRVRSSWAGSLDWREMQAAAAQQSMMEMAQMFAGQVQAAPHDDDDEDDNADEADDDETETVEDTPEDLAAANGINVKEGEKGADISNLTKDMTDTFDDISKAWAEEAPGITPVITSGSESDKHAPNSLHYKNNAVDLRTYDLTQAQIAAVASNLSTSLGNNYDVVIENNHIHMEYDPG